MSKRVLIATDLSDASRDALQQAALYTEAELGVVHAMPNLVDLAPLFPQQTEGNVLDAANLEAQVRNAVVAAVEKVVQRPAAIFVEQGLDHEVITHTARTWGADLVVMGSNGRSGLSQFVLGSVAERVSREAPCSVLVARTAVSAQGPILVATDLSDPSLPAVAVGVREAKRRGRKLVVVHVIDHALSDFASSALSQFLGVLPPRGNDDLLREAKKAAAEWVESKLKTHGAEGTVEILEGSATKQIVGRAEALDASLIVLGSHGKAGVRDVVLGSVSSRVLGTAKTSVLVARS